MSTLMRPTGPEPPMVYWIRRIAILVVVVTLLVVLWWLFGALFGGGGSSDETPTSTSSTTASTSAEPETAVSSEPAADAEPKACDDAVILVESSTDASTYTLGSTPRLTLAITNTGTVPCKRDVGPKANELEITSGGYHVWSSDDCNASDKSKVVVLKPDEPVASSITWNGRLSQKGCPDGADGAQAKAGRYDLVGRNGKVTSESTPFALRNKN